MDNSTRFSNFFLSNVPTLDPDSYPKFFSKLGFKFVELLQLKFDSPLHHTAGSQISPLHYATGVRFRRCISQRGVKSSHCIFQRRGVTPCCILYWRIRFSAQNAAGSQFLPLHDAAGIQILPLHDAAGS